MEAALIRFSENKEIIKALLDHMNDGLMITNDNKEIISINPAFEQMTGYSLDEVKGKNPSILQSNRTPRSTYNDMWGMLNTKGTWTGELCNERKDGTTFWSYITITEINEEGYEKCYIGLMRDITDRKVQEERMRYFAYHDTLTNLPNRSLFKEELERAIDYASKRNERVAVLFVDLDRFKKINDSYGHRAGDELLYEVAIRLEKVIGDKGVISRFGGDEFTIFIPHVQDKKEVEQQIEELFSVLINPFIVSRREVYITTSIGLSFYPDHGSDYDTLLRNADSAMYRTKDEGRNKYQIYELEMNEFHAEKLMLENDLLNAIHNHQFEVYYQLQVEVDKRCPFGIEALVRWNHPEKGMLPPAVFLPLAEEIGLIAEIDEWVLVEACKQTKRWHNEGFNELVVSVNISKQFFKRPDFVNRVKTGLSQADLAPNFLCVEVTENTAILKVEDIRNKLTELKADGVHISLDDFGTGYSSLNQVTLFPIDSLKIDQSFVRGKDTKENRAIVKMIIEMAKSLGISVICEGIETEDQLKLIYEEGCNLAQGYLFSKPIPAEECEILMRQLKEPVQ